MEETTFTADPMRLMIAAAVGIRDPAGADHQI